MADRLAERGDDWYAQVCVAALDPFHGYEVALRCGLPSATVVFDPVHAVRLAQDAINTVRRRVQQDTFGHRGHKGDPRYGIRRVLLRDAENRTAKAYRRLRAGLDAGDPDGHVAAASIACQELHHVAAAPGLDRARRRLDRFDRACTLPGAAALGRLGRTISAWEAQLLAYLTTAGTSNGPTEAVNLLIKRIKRVGFGFHNFANYRLRLLLHCDVTWPTHHTTRIRGRSPHSMT